MTTTRTDSVAVVGVGSRVTVRSAAWGEDWYVLVDPQDSDPARRLISTDSPMGRALLGRQAGAQVRVVLPFGVQPIEIVSVEPPDEP